MEHRILFIIDSLGPGGAERSLVELVPAVEKAGLTPTIVCLKDVAEGFQSEAIERGADVIVLSKQCRLGQLAELRKVVKRLQPSLVHTTLFESDVLGRLAATGTGIPVATSLVNTSYDPVRLEDPNVKKWKLDIARTIDGWTARHLGADFHAISETVADAAVRDLRINPERVTVITRGRELSRLGEPSSARRNETRSRLGLGDEDEILINVGRQEFQKGQVFLLEAMKTLEHSHPRLVLLIAGREGNATSDLHQACERLGLSDRVRFLGYRSDVGDLLVAADVFVFPSLYEGLGGSLLEALALGLPLVASDLPAIREAVDGHQTVSLFEPGDVATLASLVSQILRDGKSRTKVRVRSHEAAASIGDGEASQRLARWMRGLMRNERS